MTALIFTPVGPRAGPIGGPEDAFPPSTSASTVIFFAICLLHLAIIIHFLNYLIN
ncbi:MAG: hypothetical protein ACTSRZ_03285 [Promethearchaeota archaeon]